MIKANELRVGNWVWRIYAPYGHKQAWEYCRIDIEEMKRAAGILSVNSFYHDPIPLSPEILNNSGLIKSNEFDMWYGFDHRLCIEQIHGGWLWCIDDTGNNEGSIQRPLSFVHELQNIVYAVFKKELDIKL